MPSFGPTALVARAMETQASVVGRRINVGYGEACAARDSTPCRRAAGREGRMRTSARYRWYVVGVFFVFMLLHQTDRLLIGPLTPDIMATFHITMTQMGAVSTGALLVGAVLYPVWGYAYDRFSRPKLLSLASFIWGSTTWISAVAPTYPVFLATRASTGVDDSSYPGLFSLVSDYFG